MRRRRRRTKQWEHKHTFLRQILTHKLNTHTHKQESYHPSSKCPISLPDYLPIYLPITTFLIHYLPPKWNQIFANSITYYLLPITCNNNTQTFHPHARQRRRRRRLRQFQFYYSQQAHFLSLLLSHLPTLSLLLYFANSFAHFSSSPNCASVILSPSHLTATANN